MDMDEDFQPPSPGEGGGGGGDQNALPLSENEENIRGLLASARQLIDQGKPSLALQAVVTAVKSNGGEVAVMQTLNRAREIYRNKVRESAAAEELASLFAECAISQAEPPLLRNNNNDTRMDALGDVMQPAGGSILAKSGRMQVVLDAFADGSSFICLQCGGLVSNLRREEHFAYWCCQN
ncbi:hypothetical protein AMTR_s00035p00214380 [Amborella trichopoda]|uniref:C2HC zinc finger plants domain-containing protein n=2 Tax=Amborella trichopoda TaxID=13333 RepID=W1PPW0_AMBTC|nr:hypothetical protein AMTR_s00035p00214380 [Amborella trichopoda]